MSGNLTRFQVKIGDGREECRDLPSKVPAVIYVKDAMRVDDVLIMAVERFADWVNDRMIDRAGIDVVEDDDGNEIGAALVIEDALQDGDEVRRLVAAIRKV